MVNKPSKMDKDFEKWQPFYKSGHTGPNISLLAVRCNT